MFNIDKAEKEFLKYIESFDESNVKIQRKKLHSLRVMKISKTIAESLNLNKDYVDLATLIGLLHDIGRFEQENQFHTFNDLNSFDHGDFGASILKSKLRNYISIDTFDDIILTAIKNHNKLYIDESLNGDTLVFAKIIRDADKIDILYEVLNVFNVGKADLINNMVLSDYSYNFIKNKQLVINLKDVEFNELENIVKCIGFIFDLNFKKSFQIIKDNNYINKIIENYCFKNKLTQTRMNDIKRITNEYINKKL